MSEELTFFSTLTESLAYKLLFAFMAGLIGSMAYISILYFGFIGGNEKERKLILNPFLKDSGGINILKFFWYCSIGGFIAIIFQYPEKSFVPVQNFLLGVTWPSIVSQHISGRMKSLTSDEIVELSEATVTKKEEAAWKTKFSSMKQLLKQEP